MGLLFFSWPLAALSLFSSTLYTHTNTQTHTKINTYFQQRIMGYKRKQFDGHEVMLKLADPTLTNRDRYALQVTCTYCQSPELKIYQQFHYCPAIPGSKTKILINSFRCQWLLYPHDVYDLLPAADQDAILASGDFETEDAAAVIRRSFLPQVIKDQVPEKLELGLVFYARDDNITTRQRKFPSDYYQTRSITFFG